MFLLIFDVFLAPKQNNRSAGDMRRHRTHSDITVMNLMYMLLHHRNMYCSRRLLCEPYIYIYMPKPLYQPFSWYFSHIMMTSSNGNIFRITGPLCREFTGHRWIPRTKASDGELWCLRVLDLRLNKPLSKHSWRNRAHYDVIVMYDSYYKLDRLLFSVWQIWKFTFLGPHLLT